MFGIYYCFIFILRSCCSRPSRRVADRKSCEGSNMSSPCTDSGRGESPPQDESKKKEQDIIEKVRGHYLSCYIMLLSWSFSEAPFLLCLMLLIIIYLNLPSNSNSQFSDAFTKSKLIRVKLTCSSILKLILNSTFPFPIKEKNISENTLKAEFWRLTFRLRQFEKCL